MMLYRENKHNNGIKRVALNQNSSAYQVHGTIIIVLCFQFSVNTFGSVRTGNMYLSRITSMLLLPVLLAKYKQKRVAHDRTRQFPLLLLSYVYHFGNQNQTKYKRRRLTWASSARRSCVHSAHSSLVLLVLLLYQLSVIYMLLSTTTASYLVGLDLIPAAHTRYDSTLISSKLSP